MCVLSRQSFPRRFLPAWKCRECIALCNASHWRKLLINLAKSPHCAAARLHCQRPTVYAAWFILLSGLTYVRCWPPPPQFAFIHKELLAQTFIIQKFPPLQSFWDTARIACGKNVDADSDTCLLLRMWSECSDSQASTSLCLAFDIAIVCLCSQHCEDANFPRSRTRRKCPCNWSSYKDSNASWGDQLGP